MFGFRSSGGKGFSKKTIWCRNKRNQRIYGEAFIPDGTGKYPLVIYSHGYGYNMSFLEASRLAAAGIAVYEFDFCGGSPWSKSDGKSTEMSVLTEADDLEAVLDEMKKQDFVDEDRIYLCGGSQGGFVSIIVGDRRQEDVAGMILYCPALVVADFEREYLGGRPMPEKIRFGNMTVSRKYYTDARDCGVYHMMERFKRPVIYYHGSRDEMVPLRYAYESEKHFPNVKLTILPGAGHMLNYGFEDQLFSEMRDFVAKEKQNG
jgi:hypothetical protein